MLPNPLDVIWIDDDTITPPGPKRVVCIHPENGWYFRINSKPIWQNPVKIARIPNHLFLPKTVSYLECGFPLELDDFIIEESIRENGIIGTISSDLAEAICLAVEKDKRVPVADQKAIRKALNC